MTARDFGRRVLDEMADPSGSDRRAKAEVERLRQALQVCEEALHRANLMTDDDLTPLVHAAQQASQAWETDWRPQYAQDDLPGYVFDKNGFGPPREVKA